MNSGKSGKRDVIHHRFRCMVICSENIAETVNHGHPGNCENQVYGSRHGGRDKSGT